MKIRHRVPVAPAQSAVVDESYEREVQRSTAKLEREYESAQRRYEKALQRHNRIVNESARVKALSDHARRQNLATQEVERRRQELLAVERLMKAHGAPSVNRGTKSFRPIPKPGGTL